MPALLHQSSKPQQLIFLAAALTLLGGCANPGPPRPPSLHVPAIVTDLTATRIGDRVELHWTTPERTTDSLLARAPLTAELCRETNPSPSATASPSCKTILKLAVTPGPSTTDDPLSPELVHDPILPLRYRIRILNSEGRSAGDSKPAVAPSGAAPAPVTGLRITPTRDGALLKWLRPTSAPSTSTEATIVELNRTLETPVKPPAPRERKPADPLAIPEPTTITLRTADPRSTPTAQDPGGTLDRSARRGQRYTYTAHRLRIVTVAGTQLSLSSGPSPEATLAFADTFPPAPPTGLASVPSQSNNHPAIDLSWQANDETDLAGYNIYRADINTPASFTRLNSTTILGPAFTDTSITSGARYIYRVTAIDASRNESPPSAEITETAPNP